MSTENQEPKQDQKSRKEESDKRITDAYPPEVRFPDPDEGEIQYDISMVTGWIKEGYFDGQFDTLTEAMVERRLARRDAVLAQVREVFGPDATVQLSIPPEPDEPEPPALTEINPFFKKHQSIEYRVTDTVELPDDEEKVPTDALDSLPLSDVEKQMIEQRNADSIPVEQRGAIISGLAPSDMGE